MRESIAVYNDYIVLQAGTASGRVAVLERSDWVAVARKKGAI